MIVGITVHVISIVSLCDGDGIARWPLRPRYLITKITTHAVIATKKNTDSAVTARNMLSTPSPSLLACTGIQNVPSVRHGRQVSCSYQGLCKRSKHGLLGSLLSIAPGTIVRV